EVFLRAFLALLRGELKRGDGLRVIDRRAEAFLVATGERDLPFRVAEFRAAPARVERAGRVLLASPAVEIQPREGRVRLRASRVGRLLIEFERLLVILFGATARFAGARLVVKFLPGDRGRGRRGGDFSGGVGRRRRRRGFPFPREIECPDRAR